MDVRRFAFESFYYYGKVTHFDLSKFELGISILFAASVLFSFTGISYKFSRKILNSAKGQIDKSDVKTAILYDTNEAVHNYCLGNWRDIHPCDDDLVDRNLALGEINHVTLYFYWHCWPLIYRGHFSAAMSIISKLNDIVVVYENAFTTLLKFKLNANLLMECRKLDEAKQEVEKGIAFAQKSGFDVSLIEMYSCKALIHTLMGEVDESEKSLKRSFAIKSEVNAVPVQLAALYRSQLQHDLNSLATAIENGDKSNLSKCLDHVRKSAKLLLRNSRKAAQHRTETYHLVGQFYWLINKQKKAFKWWHKAFVEGERLDAMLELSRAYLAIGKRLNGANIQHNKLRGINPAEYLQKAGVLFEDMKLEWDLDELDRAMTQ